MRQAVKMLSSLEAIISLLYFSLPIIYHYKPPPVRKARPQSAIVPLFI